MKKNNVTLIMIVVLACLVVYQYTAIIGLRKQQGKAIESTIVYMGTSIQSFQQGFADLSLDKEFFLYEFQVKFNEFLQMTHPIATPFRWRLDDLIISTRNDMGMLVQGIRNDEEQHQLDDLSQGITKQVAELDRVFTKLRDRYGEDNPLAYYQLSRGNDGIIAEIDKEIEMFMKEHNQGRK